MPRSRYNDVMSFPRFCLCDLHEEKCPWQVAGDRACSSRPSGSRSCGCQPAPAAPRHHAEKLPLRVLIPHTSGACACVSGPPQRLPVNPDHSPCCRDSTDTRGRYARLSAEAEIGRTKKQQSNCFRVGHVITESAKLQ